MPPSSQPPSSPAITPRPAAWVPPANPPTRFETDRLIIRAYAAGDAEAMFRVIDDSRSTLYPWLPWAVTQNRSVDECAAAIERFHRSARDPLAPEHNPTTGYVFSVFDLATGDLLGGTGFNRISAESHNAETGYWVRADRRRQGIASEVLAATISWGFAPQPTGGFGFRRIHLFAVAPNTNSCGVPRKLGLHQTAHTRLDRWVDGLGWSDSISWDVLADEWDCQQHKLK